MQQQRIHL